MREWRCLRVISAEVLPARSIMQAVILLLSIAYVSAFHSIRTVKSYRSSVSMAAAEYNFKDTKKTLEERMKKSLDSMQQQYNTLRAGGANPSMLDRVMVDYFGTMTPLNQVARVAASGSQQLVIEPFDKSLCKDIEKSITMADLNLTPTNDGSGVIRINVPPLTEDRRKQLVKQAKTMAEDGKVAIRNIRRDAVDVIKKAEKDAGLSKDSSKEYQDSVQKITDEFIKKLDTMVKTKEKDLMTF